MPDPNYLEYLEGKHERDGVVGTVETGESDDAGWWYRDHPDGSTEWRPDGKDWAPEGFRWAWDPADDEIKLKRIVSSPTHPSKRPAVHYDSASGERYR